MFIRQHISNINTVLNFARHNFPLRRRHCIDLSLNIRSRWILLIANRPQINPRFRVCRTQIDHRFLMGRTQIRHLLLLLIRQFQRRHTAHTATIAPVIFCTDTSNHANHKNTDNCVKNFAFHGKLLMVKQQFPCMLSVCRKNRTTFGCAQAGICSQRESRGVMALGGNRVDDLPEDRDGRHLGRENLEICFFPQILQTAQA